MINFAVSFGNSISTNELPSASVSSGWFKLLMSAKTANCLLCFSKSAKIQISNYTDTTISISTLLFKEREIQIFKFSNLGTSPSYLFRAKRSLGPKCTHFRPELKTKGNYKFTFFFLFRNSHVMNYGRFQIR